MYWRSHRFLHPRWYYGQQAPASYRATQCWDSYKTVCADPSWAVSSTSGSLDWECFPFASRINRKLLKPAQTSPIRGHIVHKADQLILYPLQRPCTSTSSTEISILQHSASLSDRCKTPPRWASKLSVSRMPLFKKMWKCHYIHLFGNGVHMTTTFCYKVNPRCVSMMYFCHLGPWNSFRAFVFQRTHPSSDNTACMFYAEEAVECYSRR